MNPKKTLILFLIFVLVLAACNPAGGSAPATDVPPEENQEESVEPTPETEAEPEEEEMIDTATATPETGESACPVAADGSHLLLDAERGLCFLYPDNYDVFQSEEGGYTLYVRSLLNTEAPLASFSFEPAGGLSLGDAVAQRLVSFSLPESDIHDLELDGVPAVMLDNFPGQDTNRRVLVVNNDQVMDMMVARIGADYGAVGEQAEILYQTIIDSLRFIPPVAGAALQAGPECPEAGAGQNLYTNAEDGYCLLLPDGYAVDDSLTTDGGGAETAFYVGSPLDTAHGRLFITVADAGGKTLDEITTEKETEIESSIPGFDVTWSFGYMLDGVPANQFDQVPGQDLSRQIVLVHDNRLYTLTFIPDDPAAGDAYAGMQTLYDLVMDSFSFTEGEIKQ